MVDIGDNLKFLDDGIDFPFYNDKPKLHILEWLILVIAVCMPVIFLFTPLVPPNYIPISFFLVMVIPALYVCKGNFSLFFKKLKSGDVTTILIAFLGYYIYATVVVTILQFVGYTTSSNAAFSSSLNWLFFINMFLQLLGEEFFKIFILLIVMYLIYKLFNNRDVALWVGIIVSLLFFALIHVGSYGKIIQILLLQGVGTFFNLYAYLKTKNVVVSYIVHFLVDIIPFGLVALQVINV